MAMQTPAPPVRLQEYFDNILPAAVAPLAKSYKNLGDIALHCEQYSHDESTVLNQDRRAYDEALSSTSQYALKGLSALAYQLSVAGATLQECMDSMNAELGRSVVEMEESTQRFDMAQEAIGRKALGQYNYQTTTTTRKAKTAKVEAAAYVPRQATPVINLHALDSIGTQLQPFGFGGLQRMNSGTTLAKDTVLAATSNPSLSPGTPNSSSPASATTRGFQRIPAMAPPTLERPSSLSDVSPTGSNTSPGRPSPMGMGTIRGAIPPPPVLEATASVRAKGNAAIALPPPPPPDNLSTFLATGTVRGRPAAKEEGIAPVGSTGSLAHLAGTIRAKQLLGTQGGGPMPPPPPTQPQATLPKSMSSTMPLSVSSRSIAAVEQEEAGDVVPPPPAPSIQSGMASSRQQPSVDDFGSSSSLSRALGNALRNKQARTTGAPVPPPIPTVTSSLSRHGSQAEMSGNNVFGAPPPPPPPPPQEPDRDSAPFAPPPPPPPGMGGPPPPPPPSFGGPIKAASYSEGASDDAGSGNELQDALRNALKKRANKPSDGASLEIPSASNSPSTPQSGSAVSIQDELKGLLSGGVKLKKRSDNAVSPDKSNSPGSAGATITGGGNFQDQLKMRLQSRGDSKPVNIPSKDTSPTRSGVPEWQSQLKGKLANRVPSADVVATEGSESATDTSPPRDQPSSQRSAMLRPVSSSNSQPASRKPSGLSPNEPVEEPSPTSAPGSPSKKITGGGTIKIKAKSSATPSPTKSGDAASVHSDDMSTLGNSSDMADTSPTRNSIVNQRTSLVGQRTSVGPSITGRISIAQQAVERQSSFSQQQEQPRLSVSQRQQQQYEQIESPSNLLDDYAANPSPVQDAEPAAEEQEYELQPPSDGQDMAVALADYDATGEGQMALVAGETIRVVAWEYGNGWSYGESLDGTKRGVFPQTYVDPL
ncbi:hypothetical protein SmJEL517_g04209 [Synchytrium microbalum]|uniref:SH3 domain-containing protein n=1 Tax=Synchytrium microbalum TaxID=1806994 RepID=A0A507C586_9FUNG|nr:uncharacterized protein SmJEL517_g04209 [Synchytrium microbalum]TPX32703.1 hypothetical protein SmJEL517_g04209 [Synchytrium microbalum]